MTPEQILVLVGLWMGAPADDVNFVQSIGVERRPLNRMELAVSLRGPETQGIYWPVKRPPKIVVVPESDDNVLAHEYCHAFQDARGEEFTPRNLPRLEEECEAIQLRFYQEVEKTL